GKGHWPRPGVRDASLRVGDKKYTGRGLVVLSLLHQRARRRLVVELLAIERDGVRRLHLFILRLFLLGRGLHRRHEKSAQYRAKRKPEAGTHRGLLRKAHRLSLECQPRYPHRSCVVLVQHASVAGAGSPGRLNDRAGIDYTDPKRWRG